MAKRNKQVNNQVQVQDTQETPAPIAIVQESTLATIDPVQVQETPIANETPAMIAPAPIINKLAAMKEIASKSSKTHIATSEGNSVLVTNKDAFAVALYLLVCSTLKVAPKACNAQATRIASELAVYGCAYSERKDAARKGETTIQGCAGYIKGYVQLAYTGGTGSASSEKKAARARAMVEDAYNGNGKVASQEPAASIVVACYGKQHGLESAIAASKVLEASN